MFTTTPRLVLNLKSPAQIQQQQHPSQPQYSPHTLTPAQHRDAIHQLDGLHQTSHNTGTATSGLRQPLNQQAPPPSNIHHPQTIQIPMLSALQVPQPNPPANPPQQPQQQNVLGQQGQGIPPPPPQNGQDFTLSSVLHFLQTEWRRYERDRNEWEIERAEMRARIALLEGERRSFKNVKRDFMVRIKMLEHAINVERAKQLRQPSTTTTPSKMNTAHQSAKEDAKDASSGSSPRSEDSPLPPDRASNGIPSAQSRQPSWTGKPTAPAPVPSTLQSAGASSTALNVRAPPGRDPKSRARSREYLKQCLQEISYLTSPQAMNPLPNRPLITSPSVTMGPSASALNAGSTGGVVGAAVGGSMGMSGAQPPGVAQPPQPQGPSPFEAIYNGRPRKQLPDAAGLLPGVGPSGLPGKEFPVMGGGLGVGGGVGLPSGPTSPPLPTLERGNSLGTAGVGSHQQQQSQPQQVSSESQGEQIQQPPQSLGASSQPAPPLHHDSAPTELPAENGPTSKSLTAIFRPDDTGEWQAKLRASYGQAMQRWREGEDQETEEAGEEEDESEMVGVGLEDGDGESTKLWKPKRTLRNHLDTVRAIAFHPTELCLATGGDDCTVKIWRMDGANLASSAIRPTTESEPQLTLRGHSAAVTRIVHSPARQLIYSASLDSSIRVWELPPPSHTTYAPYDPSSARGELVGHTDAVWDLALVRDESTLISCGAEGAVKVWDVSVPGRGALRLSWGYGGLDGEGGEDEEDKEEWGATTVEAIKTDLKKVAVAYQNAVVKIFEIETGREVAKLVSNATYDGSPDTQANRIVSHPTMPILFTAHEDRFIRMFDINTGECTHHIPAHLDGVTSLSIDHTGLSLVSGSHDCSVRFWDLLHSRTCTQEITAHREKAKEGVLDVEFHPSLPFMASAGADGVVKLYASS